MEQLGKTGFESKKQWLEETAEGEKEEALKAPENDHYLVFYRGTDIAAYLSIHLEDQGKKAYLGQGCIDPTFWGQGGVAYAMNDILPKYAPNASRYTLLVRVLNERAIAAYKKLGFIVEENGELVKKHDYDPKHYLGMFKDLKK